MLKLAKRSPPPNLGRPQSVYREELTARILGLGPRTVLDVGCGDGMSLASLRALVEGPVAGLDPDPQAVDSARDRGLDVRIGQAEHLPFDNGAFDVVVLEYVAHHVEELARTLLEASRVARLGVVLLDCWFDRTFECQRVAEDHDEWLKRIDRRLGYVHFPCVPMPQLVQPFRSVGDFEIDCSTRLLLRPLDVEAVEADARRHLALVEDAQDLKDELSRLLDRARLHGVSDDGAQFVTAKRRA